MLFKSTAGAFVALAASPLLFLAAEAAPAPGLYSDQESGGAIRHGKPQLSGEMPLPGGYDGSRPNCQTDPSLAPPTDEYQGLYYHIKSKKGPAPVPQVGKCMIIATYKDARASVCTTKQVPPEDYHLNYEDVKDYMDNFWDWCTKDNPASGWDKYNGGTTPYKYSVGPLASENYLFFDRIDTPV